MRNRILFIFLLTISTNLCYSQLHLKINDLEGKRKASFSEGKLFTFYQKPVVLKNDTIIETLISGSIISIGKDSVKMNIFFIDRFYYFNDNLLFTKTVNTDENFDLVSSYAIKDIFVVIKESRLKSIGSTTSIVGLAVFFISPITSMNFQDLDYFNSSNYLVTATFGAAIGITGLIISAIAKDKFLIIQDPGRDLISTRKGKTYICNLNVTTDN